MTKSLQGFYAGILQQRTAIDLFLIILCGAAVYSNTFQVPFYFDDYPCIVRNLVVQQFSLMFELDRFRELGLEEDIRNSLVARVVAYATFALNFRIHGLNPAGYHLVNLVIHLANALLVYALLRTTVVRCRSEAAEPHERGNVLALVAALLFVAHPVQTAVTYIVQRFASLAAFFYLAAFVSRAESPATELFRVMIFCKSKALLVALEGIQPSWSSELCTAIAHRSLGLPSQQRLVWR